MREWPKGNFSSSNFPAFLPSGDAEITRKMTTMGLFWRVEVKMGSDTMGARNYYNTGTGSGSNDTFNRKLEELKGNGVP